MYQHFATSCAIQTSQHPKDFSVEELSPISPKIVYAYMAYKAFGKENPSPNDNPQKGMANSLRHKEENLLLHGKKSQADRPFEHSEFKQMLDTCHALLRLILTAASTAIQR
ncbi:hypothetical protein ACHAW5_005725 [Stephanodiscus triporus]|uniref:Uncharacterized protein n=1 Tax=Stephanodiscus triporus TaxID=2934178 RepID=A0ABD3NQE3_9STRA